VAPRTFPALGFDPAPGLGDQVSALATAVSGAAREVAAVRRTLESIGHSDGSWRGEAATAFSGTLGQLPPYLDKATEANTTATDALSRWAHDLEGFQSQAADYERQAEAARSRVDAARAALRQCQGTRAGSDPAAAQRLQQRTADAGQAVTAADSALSEILERARQLAGRHEAALAATAARIRDAADAAPPEPGFWDELGSALSSIGHWVASLPDQVGHWIEEHKYLIKAIGDLLSDVSLVVGIVSMFLPPPADVIGLAISGGLSLAAMGAHAVAWAAGAKGINALTLVADGAGALAGGAGIVGKLGTRGAEEAIRIGAATGKGGMVAAGEDAFAYYSNIDNGSTVGGLLVPAVGYGNNAVADGKLSTSDIPFAQWVPRSSTPTAAVLTGPAGVAFANYVGSGNAEDAAADAEAERERWIR
jgi:hypothetical protein